MKKVDFSKILVIAVIIIFTIICLYSMIEYYELVKLAIEKNSSTIPDSDVATTCITTILGAVISYCLYQGALKTSLNKNGLRLDDVTGVVSSIKDNEFLEAAKQTSEIIKEKKQKKKTSDEEIQTDFI